MATTPSGGTRMVDAVCSGVRGQRGHRDHCLDSHRALTTNRLLPSCRPGRHRAGCGRRLADSDQAGASWRLRGFGGSAL